MPCRDPEGDRYYAEKEAKVVREKIDKLTRMLCGLCGRLEGSTGYYSPEEAITDDNELEKWWKEHKESDRIREERELLGLEEKGKL